jgi:hypothetical protein
MTPLLTAILPHYFAERLVSLRIACEALLTGTLVPDEILIWNNDQPFGQGRERLGMDRLIAEGTVQVIQSPRNIGPHGRFLAALMARGDLIWFQDNDVMVERQTLDHVCARYANDIDEVVESLEGRRLTAEGGYRSSLWFRPEAEEQGVDLTLGRGELVSRGTLRRALQQFDWDCPMDDLAFSYALRRLRIPIWIPPAVPEAGLRNLPEGGVGARFSPNHYPERDTFCRQHWSHGEAIIP